MERSFVFISTAFSLFSEAERKKGSDSFDLFTNTFNSMSVLEQICWDRKLMEGEEERQLSEELLMAIAIVINDLIAVNKDCGGGGGRGSGVLRLLPMNVDILAFMERIKKYAKCSDACFVVGLIYVDRVVNKHDFVLTVHNVRLVLLTAVMVAAKFHEDVFYNNAFFAQLGGVTVREINASEIQLLQLLHFSTVVTSALYDKYSSQLRCYRKRANALASLKTTLNQQQQQQVQVQAVQQPTMPMPVPLQIVPPYQHQHHHHPHGDNRSPVVPMAMAHHVVYDYAGVPMGSTYSPVHAQVVGAAYRSSPPPPLTLPPPGLEHIQYHQHQHQHQHQLVSVSATVATVVTPVFAYTPVTGSPLSSKHHQHQVAMFPLQVPYV